MCLNLISSGDGEEVGADEIAALGIGEEHGGTVVFVALGQLDEAVLPVNIVQPSS